MKGPFNTLDEARAHAEVGESIMARDAFHYRGESWCVMNEKEVIAHVHNPLSSWRCHWETIK
jgi:hypothetical protein